MVLLFTYYTFILLKMLCHFFTYHLASCHLESIEVYQQQIDDLCNRNNHIKEYNYPWSVKL